VERVRDSVDAVDGDDRIGGLGGHGGAGRTERNPNVGGASAGASLIPSPTITTGRSAASARIRVTTSSLSAGDCSA
jgi:hypothetical protein